MATDVLMPQMGESIAEGTITRWMVQIGESIERDQPLLEISTDKVDAEIPSPAGGVLLAILHPEGETVSVNEVIGRIGAPGEAVASEASGQIESAGTPVPGTPAEGTPVQGTPAEGTPAEGASAADVSAPDTDEGPTSLETRLRLYSSPVVRKIAAEHGIEIARVAGSGVHGRVTKQDILGFIASGAADAPAPTSTATTASAPAPARGTGGFAVAPYLPSERVEIEPMSRIRQLTAAHMTYSKATSAHVTTVFEIDMTRIDRLRRKIKSAFLRQNGTKLTYMPFIFRAVSGALKRFPQLNASIDGNNIIHKKDINLGMAVAMDRGLIVPVIKNADTLSLIGLARTANDLAERARNKRLKPEETQAGTFTVTNPGVFGSLFGTPIINQPQVAIMSIGTIEKRPVVVTAADGSDALAIRTLSYFAITFDHRLIDGADADHFMAEIKETLQKDDWKELAAYR